MGQSIILLINELAPNQTNAYQTVNDAVAALEAACNEALVVDATAGNYTVPILDTVRYVAFRVQNHTANMTLSFPNEVVVTPATPTQRLVAVVNEENYTVTVNTTAAAASVAIPPFASKIVLIDGNDVLELSASVNATPHTIGVYSFGTPGANDVMLSYNFLESVLYDDEFAGAVGVVGTNPTANPWTATVNKNGAPVGSVAISSAGAFTFTTTGTTVQFDPGDLLTIVAPGSMDATIAGIAFTLKARRL